MIFTFKLVVEKIGKIKSELIMKLKTRDLRVS